MKDIFDRELSIGSWVATPGKSGRARLIIGRIVNIGTKVVTLRPIGKAYYHMRYPEDVILVDDIKELSLFLLAKEQVNG